MLKKHVPKKQKHDELSELEKQYMKDLLFIIQTPQNSFLLQSQTLHSQKVFNEKKNELTKNFLQNITDRGLEEFQKLNRQFLEKIIELYLKNPNPIEKENLFKKIKEHYKKTIDYCYINENFEYAFKTHEVLLKCEPHLTTKEFNQIKFNYKNAKLTFNPNESIKEFETNSMNIEEYNTLSLLEKQKHIAYLLHELFQLSENTLLNFKSSTFNVDPSTLIELKKKQTHIQSLLKEMKTRHPSIADDSEYKKNFNVQYYRYENIEKTLSPYIEEANQSQPIIVMT